MESHRPLILASSSRTPLALAKHFALVMLWYVAPASLADIRSSLWITVPPLKVLPLQPLHVIAMRAWNEVTALIRCQILRLYSARVFNCWRRGQDDFAATKR